MSAGDRTLSCRKPPGHRGLQFRLGMTVMTVRHAPKRRSGEPGALGGGRHGEIEDVTSAGANITVEANGSTAYRGEDTPSRARTQLTGKI